MNGLFVTRYFSLDEECYVEVNRDNVFNLGAVEVLREEDITDWNLTYTENITFFISPNLPFIYYIWWSFFSVEGLNHGILGARGHCEPTFVYEEIVR